MRRFFLLLVLTVMAVIRTAFTSPVEYVYNADPVHHEKRIHYWSAGLDSVYITTRYLFEEATLQLNTRHNLARLISVLDDSLGKSTFKEAPWGKTSPQCGTFNWTFTEKATGAPLSLQLDIKEEPVGINAYSVLLFVFDRHNHNRATESGYTAWWKNMIRRNVLTQPADTFVNKEPLNLDLFAVFNWNTDSLCTVFKQFISQVDDEIAIKIAVNPDGSVGDVKTVPSDSVLERQLRCLPEDGFPVIVEKQTGDTLHYELGFTLHMPRRNQLEYYENQLNGYCADCVELADTSSGEIRFYHARIARGHLFSEHSEQALVQLYGLQEICLFEKENEKWIFRDSIRAEATGSYYTWYFEELDGAPAPEISLRSGSNSNGNSWSTLIRYNNTSMQLYIGGHFNTNYKPDFARHELLTEYGGSWYMPTYHEIQKWVNGKLVGYKKVEIALKEATMESDESIMTVYENPWWKTGRDTLIPVRHYRYTGTPAQKKIYELFGGRKVYE